MMKIMDTKNKRCRLGKGNIKKINKNSTKYNDSCSKCNNFMLKRLLKSSKIKYDTFRDYSLDSQMAKV